MSDDATGASSGASHAADAETFREVMRQFASSVTIITTVFDGETHGMTATAVSSVSAEPPIILVVVNQTARCHRMIETSGGFMINLLSRDQHDLADRFARKGTDRFDGIDYFESPNTHSPILSGIAAYIECEVIDQAQMSTHTVFFGKVLHCTSTGKASLIYHAGQYGGVDCLAIP